MQNSIDNDSAISLTIAYIKKGGEAIKLLGEVRQMMEIADIPVVEGSDTLHARICKLLDSPIIEK